MNALRSALSVVFFLFVTFFSTSLTTIDSSAAECLGAEQADRSLGVNSQEGATEGPNRGCDGGGGTPVPTPGVPASANVVGNLSTGDITFEWGASSNTGGQGYLSVYEVYERVNGGSWVELPSVVAPGTAATRKKVFSSKPDGTYQYRVRALNEQVSTNTLKRSAFRETGVVTVLRVPGAPGPVSNPGTTIGSYTITWGQASGQVTRYEWSEQKNGGSWSGWTANAGSLSRAFSGKTDGTYRYRVQACNASGCGADTYGQTFTVINKPGTPGTISITPPGNITNGVLNISWGASSGQVDTYELYERMKPTGGTYGGWTKVYENAANSVQLTGRTNGFYDYYVKAENVSGFSSDRHYAFEKRVLFRPGTPGAFNIESGLDADGTFSVGWGTASGEVTGYKLHERYRPIGDAFGSWNLVYSGSLVSVSRDNMPDGDYDYYVEAYNGSGDSSHRHYDSLKKVLRKPGLVPAFSGPANSITGNYDIDWAAAASGQVDEYVLQEAHKPIGGGWSGWNTIHNATATIKSRSSQADGLWNYRVRACNDAGCGSAYTVINNPVNVLKTPTAPASVNAVENSEGEFNLSWGDAFETVTSFEWRQRTNGSWGSWTVIASNGPVSLSLGDGVYRFEVKACNNACGPAAATNDITVTHDTPSIPGVIGIPSGTQGASYSIDWSLSTGSVDRYDISHQLNGGSWGGWQGVPEAPAGGQVVHQITAGQAGDWKHRVRACNIIPGGEKCGDARVSGTVVVEVEPEWARTGGDFPDAPIIPVNAPLGDNNVGALEGSGGVSGGSASYTIPIAVVPGRKGMQPSVSVNYSSRAGNGIAGMGWSISAGGGISRCGATAAQDGFTAGVQYDAATDRLCLNGQRLVKINGGAYGTSGSEYRTELESFAKVVQSGSINSASSSFTVYTRDNKTSYYGGTADSRQSADGRSEIMTWALNQTQDPSGNNVKYIYAEFGAGEHLLTDIHYTGHNGSTGDRHVRFNYQNRVDSNGKTDYSSSYLAGGMTRQTQRLQSVQTVYQSTVVRDYKLHYGAVSLSSGRTLLRSVEECVENGLICLPATNFEWQERTTEYVLEPVIFKDGNQDLVIGADKRIINEAIPHGDTNGDGVKDWPGYYVNAEGQITGTQDSERFSNCYLPANAFDVICIEADFNFDGRTDSFKKVNGELKIRYTGTTNWISTDIPWTNPLNKDAPLAFTDLDGDGWIDILFRTWGEGTVKPKLWAYYHTQSVNAPYSDNKKQLLFTYGTRPAQPERIVTSDVQLQGDLDGNGLQDFIIFNADPDTSVPGVPVPQTAVFVQRVADGSVNLSNTYTFNNNLATLSMNASVFHDVNADGLTDWLVVHPQTFNLNVRLNEGGSFASNWIDLGVRMPMRGGLYAATQGEPEPYSYPAMSKVMVMDYNGDGRSELMLAGDVEVSSCANIQAYYGGGLRCNDALYGNYQVGIGDTIDTAINSGVIDDSIREYKAIYFDENLSGGIDVRIEATDIIASASQKIVLDATGDGLPDVVTTFGCRANQGCVMGRPGDPEYDDGDFADGGGDTVLGECTTNPMQCAEDINGDGVINGCDYDPEFCGDDEPPCGLLGCDNPPPNPRDGGATAANNTNYIETLEDANLTAGTYINRNLGASSDPDKFEATDLMKKVTNGFGVVNQWTYRPLSSDEYNRNAASQSFCSDPTDPSCDSFYEMDPAYVNGGDINSSDPEYFHFASSMYVVAKQQTSNGVGGLNDTLYRYTGATFNNRGRGFQGFRSIIVEDTTNGLKSRTDFHQKWPLTGRAEIACSWKSTANEAISNCGNGHSESSSTYYAAYSDNNNLQRILNPLTTPITMGRPVYVPSAKSTAYTRDLNSQTLMSTTTSEVLYDDYDSFGSATLTTSIHEDAFGKLEKAAHRQFTNNVGNWWLGRLDSSTDISESITNRGGGSAGIDPSLDPRKTVITNYTWHTTHRLPSSVSVQGGATVSSTYNSHGLPTVITTSAAGEASRSVSTEYAGDGYFATKVTNALGHETSMNMDPVHGQPLSVTDPNQQTVTTQYDPFGRAISVNAPGQPALKTIYQWCNNCGDGVANIRYMVTTAQDGAPLSTQHFDQFNRNLLTKIEHFDGSPVYTLVQFGSRGEKLFESVPSKGIPDEVTGTRYYNYDALLRLGRKEVDQVVGVFDTTYSYDGFVTTVRPVHLEMKRAYNGQNQLMWTQDAHQNYTRYAYDAAGNPIVIEDASGNKIEAKYDNLGRKEYVDDPNMGVKTFTYNGFNELLSEMDATGDVLSYEYDLLGRMTQRDINGSRQGLWVYDNQNKGKGLLDYSWNSNASERRFYNYDSLKRLNLLTVRIDGEEFPVETHYDNYYGRVKGMRYPTGLGLKVDYNARGYAYKESNAATDYVYSEITEQDAWGNINVRLLGAGALNEERLYSTRTSQMAYITVSNGSNEVHHIDYETYDVFGNIKRKNLYSGGQIVTTEVFDYDNLQRLKTSERLQVPGSLISYNYDNIGNLLSKSDYGTLYDYTGTGNCGNKPSAVCRVTKTDGTLADFTYDASGNLLSGDGKLIEYDAFNKPTKIEKGSVESTFSYGADIMRYKQVKTGLPGGTETTLYIDKLVEKITQGGKTKIRQYIGDYAVVEKAVEMGQEDYSLSYLLTDRLGSVASVTDHNGVVTESKGFDPFGKPRDASWHDLALPILDSDVTTRGFTGHEHLDDAQLIHMNGRAYDYNLGRFLSVDPFVQDPGNSQSMNPYSYIMNNPLAGVDPTGYAACSSSDGLGCLEDGLNQVTDANTGAVTQVYVGNKGETVRFTGSQAGSKITATVGAAHFGDNGIEVQHGSNAVSKLSSIDTIGGQAGISESRRNLHGGGGLENVEVNGNTVTHTSTKPLEDYSPEELEGVNFNILWDQEYSPDLAGMKRMSDDYKYLNAIYENVVANRSWGSKLFYGVFGDPNAPQMPIAEAGFSGAFRLVGSAAKWLGKGSKNTNVYLGINGGKAVYVGITRQTIAMRQAQHGSRFTLERVTSYALTRNQARAVEQAIMLRNPQFLNKINSISPRRKIYDDAVKWGNEFLKGIGL